MGDALWLPLTFLFLWRPPQAPTGPLSLDPELLSLISLPSHSWCSKLLNPVPVVPAGTGTSEPLGVANNSGGGAATKRWSCLA